jgi:hypothetical protein
MFGAPPVLNDESVENYNDCYRNVMEFFQPCDAIELRLARSYADHDWTVCRWLRMESQMLSNIDKGYVDKDLVLLKRGDRLQGLVAKAEDGRNRAYRDFIMHRKLLNRDLPGEVKASGHLIEAQPDSLLENSDT